MFIFLQINFFLKFSSDYWGGQKRGFAPHPNYWGARARAAPPESTPMVLIKNELFHQSSFYLKNIILSFQLLFQQRYLHFSPGGKSGEMSGGNVQDPMRSLTIHPCMTLCRAVGR